LYKNNGLEKSARKFVVKICQEEIPETITKYNMHSW